MNSILPYSTYEGKVCVNRQSLIDFGIATKDLWEKWMKFAKKNNFIRRIGGNGRTSLIEFLAIPNEYKLLIIEKFGNPSRSSHPLEQFFQLDGNARADFQTYSHTDGSGLTDEQRLRYTIDASVLNALAELKLQRESLHKQQGKSRFDGLLWKSLSDDINSFKDVLKTKHNGITHKLPHNVRSLQRLFWAYTANNKRNYTFLIDGRVKNQAAAKVKTNEQTTMLEALLHKHSNLNDVQVRDLYNTVASTLIWPTITESTVANKRVELGIAIHIGRHGIKDFVNKKSYTVKRSAPKSALTYWTLDGWVAELLYQQKEQRSTSMVTTYHNRLTVVVVLDTCVKYPIGYAIGKQEDTSLIKQALKNAVNHTRELFGTRYKSNQLQTDNFGGAELKDLYSAVTGHYTPARVGNAKAKVIEPYFSYLNKKCQVYFDNWSGFNVDSRKENQPNAEFIQKNRSLLPDENGVRNQIHQLLQMERTTKLVEYKKFFEALPEEDRKPISNEEFLYLFGETHSHTNKLNGDGITPVLLGQSLSFDTFNERFRQYAYMDWAIKYDPEDLTQVLAVNAKSDHNSKVTEVIGSHQFLLDQKYVQPMALYERKDGDGAELSKVQQFNKNLGQKLLNRHDQVNKAVEQTFAMHDELNDTLKKMILPDSTGNYKKLKQAAERKKTVKTEPKQLPVANTDFEIIETDIRQQY